MKYYSVVLGLAILLSHLDGCFSGSGEQKQLDKANTTLYSIKGRVTIEKEDESNWLSETFVVADGGKYHGYLKNNGEFAINRVLSGSYLVEVVSPNYVFNSVRVDITKSGRIRVREVNFTKPTKDLERLSYPLHFKANETVAAQVFEEKETLYTLVMKNPENMLQMALYITLAILLAVSLYVMPIMVESNQNQISASELKDMQQNLMWWLRLPSLEEIFATLSMGGDLKELFTKAFEEETKPSKKDALGSTRKKKNAAAKNKRRPK